jgi:hypothetical protein
MEFGAAGLDGEFGVAVYLLMEIKMRRGATGVLLALFLASGAAQAAQWASALKSADQQTEAFVDVSDIETTEETRLAWIKLVIPPHSRNGFRDNAGKWVTYSVSQKEFNCNKATVRGGAATDYFEDGSAAPVTDSQFLSPWEAVPPNTGMSVLMHFVCAANAIQSHDLDAPLMNSAGGQIGSFFGLFIVTLIGPLILLIIFKLIAVMRKRPAVSNGIAGALGVLMSFVPVGTPLMEKIVVAVLMAALFYWQYVRDVKALAKASTLSATGPQ